MHRVQCGMPELPSLSWPMHRVQCGGLVPISQYDIKGALLGFFHDFSVTDNYYVVVENPTRLDFAKMMTQYMFGLKSLGECIEFVSDQPARVHLLPRPGSHPSAKRHVVDIEVNKGEDERMPTWIIERLTSFLPKRLAFHTGDPAARRTASCSITSMPTR